MAIITILKIYFIFVVVLMLVYAIRHAIFSYQRVYGKQRMYYNDISDSELPYITVLVPMYNEEKVLTYVLDALLKCSYDKAKLEIIPINDHSTDATEAMLNEYAAKYDCINPLHRRGKGQRGKAAGLNDALDVAKGEFILVFDADYRPGKDLLRQLTLAFEDPGVGAVMGRVIPYNPGKNWLTRLLN